MPDPSPDTPHGTGHDQPRGSHRAAGAGRPATRGMRLVGPALLVLLVGGLIAAAAGAWRPGLLVVAGGLLLTTTLRLALPPLALGTFAVRARWLDAAFLLTSAIVLLVATLALP